MKNFFAIATLALVSMSAAMTSCSNGEADDVMAPAPAQSETTAATSYTYSDMVLYIPVDSMLQEHFDYKLTIESPMGSETVDVYSLPSSTDVTFEHESYATESGKLKADVKMYKFNGQIEEGTTIKVTSDIKVKAPFADFGKAHLFFGLEIQYKLNGKQNEIEIKGAFNFVESFDASNEGADAVMNDLASSMNIAATRTYEF